MNDKIKGFDIVATPGFSNAKFEYINNDYTTYDNILNELKKSKREFNIDKLLNEKTTLKFKQQSTIVNLYNGSLYQSRTYHEQYHPL